MLELKTKAKALYDEQRTEYIYYHGRKQGGFKRRVKALARKISVTSEILEETQAMMYLDIVATRIDIDLNRHYQT